MRKHLIPVLLAASALLLAIGAGGAGASTSGMFVIGDGNAATNGHVTFWGAQWWKDNSVSGGTAPASFKGYAVDFDSTTCTFTADPGDSGSPPSPPLPDTISVLVTSSVTKSGSTISGVVSAVAQVSTDGGYDSDPGHAGTGTVLSVTSCTPGQSSF